MLDRMSTLLERNYFVPLGPLETGEYRLELGLDTDSRVSLQLVSETFDTVVEDCYDTSGKRLTIPFTITEPGNHYLRAYPRVPVRLLDLTVLPVPIVSALPRTLLSWSLCRSDQYLRASTVS